MAEQLTSRWLARSLARWLARPGRRRLLALVALLGAVVIVHGCVAEQMFEQMADRDAARATPARLAVSYVRAMDLSAPLPAVAAAPTAPMTSTAPIAPAARARAAKPAAAASAARAAKAAAAALAAEPASAALRVSEDAQAANQLAAASAPVAEIAAVAAAVAPTEPASGAAPAELTTPPTPTAPASAGATRASSAAGSAPVAANAFEWPVSTRISYRLTGNYRGEVNGTAQVEWIRAGDQYQVHLDLVIGAKFAPLITRRMSSDGTISADGLVPRRYDQDTKVMLRPRHQVALQFEADSVVLANGERRPKVRGVQDTASQFVQLTYVFSTRPELLNIGGSVEIPLALPNKVDVWTYDVVAEETLATPFGALASVHLKPRRTAPPKVGELSAEIWFAPQLRYLPVRIRIHQDEQTFIDLMIDKRPEQGG